MKIQHTIRRSRRAAAVWLSLGLLGASGLYWQARPDSPAARPAAQVRTVRVRSAPLERTLRLTGVISPERFASLLAPQLRGTRGGVRGGGGGGGGGSSAGGSSSGSSSSSGSGSSSQAGSGSQGSSGASASSASASGSAGMAGAAGNLGTSGTSGLRSALSRFSAPATSAPSTARKVTGGPRPMVGASSGTSVLGSTGGSLGTGGGLGGGGGMGDFSLVLQTSVPGGTRVKKGQVLAEFDRQYMLLRLDDFRAGLEDQEASLKTLEANLDVDKKAHHQSIEAARAKLEKAKLDLKTVPVQSDIQSEKLKLAAEEAEATYKRLLSEVKPKDIAQKAEYRIAVLDRDESRVQLDRIQANADRMLLKSPMDGLVVMGTTFRGSEFSQLQPGDQVHPGMMVMRVVDPNSMVINAGVNQVDIEHLRIGMKARVRFDAYPDLQLPARVYSIAAMPRSGGVRVNYVKEVPVVLKLEGMDPRVIPDLSVSVDVVLEETPDSPLVPREGIFRDEKTGKPFAFVQAGGAWERREVELGPMNNVAAVIRNGLRPGEVVAAEWPVEKGK